jgi:hypothetical protein
MGRTLTAGTLAQSLLADGAKPIFLVELVFDGGAVRTWSGRGDLVFDGDTYSGTGDLGAISPAQEGREQRAFSITYRLSGIPASNLSLALDQDVVGRAGTVWLGFLDSSYDLVADPTVIFRGRMDTMTVRLGDSAEVAVTIVNRAADWDVNRERLYTDVGQRTRNGGQFADDTGLRFVTQTVERKVIWGVAP